MQEQLTKSGPVSLSFSRSNAPLSRLFYLNPSQAVRRLLSANEDISRSLLQHLIFIIIIFMALQLNRMNIKAPQVVVRGPAPDARSTSQRTVPALSMPKELIAADGELLLPMAVPHTIIPDRSREQIASYAVKGGDTIFGIAAQYGIAPETVMWANPSIEQNPDLLRIGQDLVILPVDGVYYQVGKGDTIENIAATYKVNPEAILSYKLNMLDGEEPVIHLGQWLVVPGGTKPYIPREVVAYSGPIPKDAAKGSGNFGWPTSGTITQGFWSRHRALDIGGWIGAPVNAADSGYVIAAGMTDVGYGNMVVIDHGNGFATLYGHLNKILVAVGDSVAKGQQIGEMGNTGNSTGPHLHFEVRQKDVLRNPYGFLP